MRANRAVVSVLGLLQNPMILIGIVGLGVMIGMPKLMENSKEYKQHGCEHALTILQWTLRCVKSLRSSKQAIL